MNVYAYLALNDGNCSIRLSIQAKANCSEMLVLYTRMFKHCSGSGNIISSISDEAKVDVCQTRHHHHCTLPLLLIIIMMIFVYCIRHDHDFRKMVSGLHVSLLGFLVH